MSSTLQTSNLPFSDIQPQDGDRVLHCGHLGKKNRCFHWWNIPKGMSFTRPDSTTGKAFWITACEQCIDKAGGDFTRLEIRGDGTWQGNAPAIRDPRN